MVLSRPAGSSMLQALVLQLMCHRLDLTRGVPVELPDTCCTACRRWYAAVASGSPNTDTPTSLAHGLSMDQVRTSNGFKGRHDGLARICNFDAGGRCSSGGGGDIAENLSREASHVL
ncbi:hypothetical protein Vretimale_10655 [Volvox reticuliferus]|uniref:Secreted protein n=1 Tax=Volvox reticuliferus TaxID=1737510 RepID=A0A8J4CNQ8_9CHLO|nr:hypothetical protein Vretifemale_13940 [Volvox reticuliferus]GIM06325.1 hypothetical protein Vretimale_10655 [Volvox reticuliferus]